MTASRVILGIDPGTQLMGYGVIEVCGNKPRFVTMGVIDMRRESDHYLKLRTIYKEVALLIDKYSPDDLAIEAPFYGKNIQSMLKLGRAQGCAISAALNRDIPVFEYAPRKVKMAITGRGAASKEQVAMLLQSILKYENREAEYDASDGLAVALCHFYQLTNPITDRSASTSWKAFVESHPSRIK